MRKKLAFRLLDAFLQIVAYHTSSYAFSSCLSLWDKEGLVTKTHVAMSEFYNNLPGHLRLPASATKQLSPPVYQFKEVILNMDNS